MSRKSLQDVFEIDITNIKHSLSSHPLILSADDSFFAGIPTIVKTNILIRSMGPVSELDMVRK